MKLVNIQKGLIFATRPFRYAIESLSYKLLADVSGLMALQNRYFGRPMLVIGNGPSLNETPLDEFLDVPAIGMNKIDLIFSRRAWRPTLIVCVNSLVAKQHQDSFAESRIPVYIAWKSRWLIRRENREKLSYFNLALSNRFATNALHGFGSSATVTYVALQMAYWLGANPVILFGVDHNFTYAGPNSTYQRREGPDKNHFDSKYFQAGSYWATPDLHQSEIEYLLARQAFEVDGRSVYDATLGGKLTVFDKISLEEVRELTQRSKAC